MKRGQASVAVILIILLILIIIGIMVAVTLSGSSGQNCEMKCWAVEGESVDWCKPGTLNDGVPVEGLFLFNGMKLCRYCHEDVYNPLYTYMNEDMSIYYYTTQDGRTTYLWSPEGPDPDTGAYDIPEVPDDCKQTSSDYTNWVNPPQNPLDANCDEMLYSNEWCVKGAKSVSELYDRNISFELMGARIIDGKELCKIKGDDGDGLPYYAYLSQDWTYQCYGAECGVDPSFGCWDITNDISVMTFEWPEAQ